MSEPARDPVARLGALVDAGTLRVEPEVRGCGVRVGTGLVEGRRVVAFACNPDEGGGALGDAGCAAIVAAIGHAEADRLPVIGVWHSGGARLQEGVTSLHGVGRMFHALVSATVPLVSVVLGPAAGGAAYGPALTDIVVTGPDGRIFVTGPDIVRAVTGEAVDAEQLGGPQVHARESGVVHVATHTDDEALNTARRLVSLLASVDGIPGETGLDTRMRAVLPASTRTTYDVHDVIRLLLDPDAPTVELHRSWAPNVVTTLGWLGGAPVAVLANNPDHLVGCLDCRASDKAAAFVGKVDRLGVPLVVLVDVPGYLPGRDQEAQGVVVRGAALLRAFAQARVPRVTVVVRKAYGGAFIAMNSRALGATAVYAWPAAEVGVMDPHGAVEIIHRRLLAGAPRPERARLLALLARQYERDTGGLDRAVAGGQVDAIIDPAATRQCVAAALRGSSRTQRAGSSSRKWSDGATPSSLPSSAAHRSY